MNFKSISRIIEVIILLIFFVQTSCGQKFNLKNEVDKESYLFGKEVAQDYYKPTGAALASGVTTFLLVPLGLGTTVLICSRPVKEKKIPEKFYEVKNDLFIDGFQSEALKKKRKAAWVGSGTGFGVFVVLFVALALSQP